MFLKLLSSNTTLIAVSLPLSGSLLLLLEYRLVTVVQYCVAIAIK